MPRIQLLGGAYESRSLIASAQRCVNLYPEVNPRDSQSPVTHYPRPGLRALARAAGGGTVRGLYRASTGQGYCVIGQGFYSISPGWALTLLGTLVTPLTTPVSMVDNRQELVIVDNSSLGYSYNLTTGIFSQITDPTGIFQGGTKVDYIDTFLLFNSPGTNQFVSTLSNQLVFDGLYFASKVGYPDTLATLIVSNHYIYLIGQLKTEVWYNAGNPQFPFALLPGVYYEHGTVAPWSVSAQDGRVYLLHQDLQGQGIVIAFQGYSAKRISNHALEYAIRRMAASGSIADAIGYCYQTDGHVFYTLTFPTGNQTWTYDESTEQWHQRAWSDANGNLNRDRTNCCANINSTIVVGDWENGTLYALDPAVYEDQVAPLGAPSPITRIRSFPRLNEATFNFGAPGFSRDISWDGKRIAYDSFELDLQCGAGALDSAGNPPLVQLRYSDDRGMSWSNYIAQSAGAPGVYNTWPVWRNLGTARDRVWEVSYSFAGECALQGAWTHARVMET